MSIRINTKTPNKKEIAAILEAIANWIRVSGNQTITISLDISFNQCEG